MKVEVDREKCCGGGQCVLLAPDVFDQGEEDAVVILLQDKPEPQQWDSVREAVAVCPAAAIAIVE
jgi:ferredoxin